MRSGNLVFYVFNSKKARGNYSFVLQTLIVIEINNNVIK